MFKPLIVALASAGLMFAAAAQADNTLVDKAKAGAVPVSKSATPAAAGDLNALKKLLESRLEGLVIGSIRQSEVPGLVEIAADGRLLYASRDGQYLINGTLFDLQNNVENLTEKRLSQLEIELAPQRAKDIEALGEKSMIVYKAKAEKHKVTVFTDVDCGYCRKLHAQMADYNNLGITIRYAAFPRAGIPSESYDKLQSVWCAANPQQAMTEAKHDGNVPKKTCDNPIQKHFAMVRKLGLSGTPALILENGTVLAGYVPPTELNELLEKKTAKE